jgi:sigma-E factor negative regulatory protein RseC
VDSGQATVLAVGPERALVRVSTAPACARCAAGQGCGAGLFERRQAAELAVRVAPNLALRPGDRVRLELAPERLLAVAGLAYGLPLAGLVAGALAAGGAAPGHELAAVIGALGGLAAGVLLGRRGLTREERAGRCLPVAADKLG